MKQCMIDGNYLVFEVAEEKGNKLTLHALTGLYHQKPFFDFFRGLEDPYKVKLLIVDQKTQSREHKRANILACYSSVNENLVVEVQICN